MKRDDVLRQVSEWVAFSLSNGGQAHTLSYVNAHCLNIACRDQGYFNALRNFDLVYPDGIGAVWAGRWLHGSRLYKMTGADWIFQFCEMAQISGWRIFILGGKAGVAQKARVKLTDSFPALHISGARDGYFSDHEVNDLVSEIITAQPDILFVGLGVPLQEAWISEWKRKLPVKIFWAVGALFDYVAGVEPRAPRWMRVYGFEWFWRLLVDPKGKWRRYILGNPLFFARVVRQKLSQIK